jgi:hypothetical protein
MWTAGVRFRTLAAASGSAPRHRSLNRGRAPSVTDALGEWYRRRATGDDATALGE